MPSDQIQWFPGHMAKTRRLIQENLPRVDILLELLDARIPHSSRNPEIHTLSGKKPMLTLLNKADLADPQQNRAWLADFEKRGEGAMLIDCNSGEGVRSIPDAIRHVLSDKVERYKTKGMEGRRLRAMIVGIPNVGKSSLINRISGAAKTRVENRPGVTMTKQWIGTDIGIDLMDMPGVLWPKFDDRRVGEHLAFTGAIRDGILDREEIAMTLSLRLREIAPDALCRRYRLEKDEIAALDGYDLLSLIGARRGMLLRGNEVDMTRAANMLLDEFRRAAIGRITLETPGDM